MELKFTAKQLIDIVDVIIGYWCREEINNRLYANDYLKDKGIDDLSPEEFQAAVQVLHDRMYDNIIEGDWGLNAMDVIDCIVAERPKEEPKPVIPSLYGLTPEQMKEVWLHQDKQVNKDLIKIVFDEYFIDKAPLTEEELGNALNVYELELGIRCQFGEIAYYAIQKILDDRKPQTPDLLNDTLNAIGLKTNQGFLVDDDEYRGTTFYFDSFGDIYTNGEDEDVYHDYLTLGRILTQYHDKIIPVP